MITRQTAIEELVNSYPSTVQVLSEKGIRCIRCGEPVWGTLEEAAMEKGFDDDYIDNLVKGLNELVRKPARSN